MEAIQKIRRHKAFHAVLQEQEKEITKTTLQSLSSSLTNYDIHEARSIIRVLLEDEFSMSYTDILTGGIDRLSDINKEKLNSMIARLQQGEPVQYVTGKAWFCNRLFHVEEGVLIPRPETEELCQWIIDDGMHGDVLDIGTGSGCIAITLRLEKSDASGSVSAWDISPEALSIARDNAARLNADVTFSIQDALNAPIDDNGKWDIIVSNPPYICNSESKDMERNVLDYEPSLALFVPDNDPLLFYRKIAEYAIHALRPEGCLYFEINPLYINEMTSMLSSIGFIDIESRKDAFGKVRMIKCKKQ